MNKLRSNIIFLLILLTMSGCATAKLHKVRGTDPPEITSEFTTNHSKLIKTKTGEYYINSKGLKQNNFLKEWILISSEGTSFYKNLNTTLHLTDQIKVDSINLIIDEREWKSSKHLSKKISASLGFTTTIDESNKPLFISKKNVKDLFPEYDELKNKCLRKTFDYNYNLLKSVIMDQWKKQRQLDYSESYITPVALLDKDNKIIDDTCPSIIKKINNNQISHLGALFAFQRYTKKDGQKTKIHNSYVAIPFNIIDYSNFGYDLKINHKQQKTTDTLFNPLLNRKKRMSDYRKKTHNEFVNADKYFIQFSDRKKTKDPLMEFYDTKEIGSISRSFEIPTTLTIVTSKSKDKKYPLALRVIGTPAALAFDILTSPFQLSYLLLILTFGPG